MNVSRFVFIVYCGVIANSLLLFLFGEEGLLRYNRLFEHKTRLENNIADLGKKNDALHEQLDTIASSPARVAVLARDLGYYGDDERIFVIDGYTRANSMFEIGTSLETPATPTDVNPVLRIIVMCATITAIVITMAFSRKIRHDHQRIRQFSHRATQVRIGA